VNKNVKLILIIGAVAVAGYFAWRWWQGRQSGTPGTSPTGSFGTNLNSVAPELVGGSTGPSVGPALSTPVNITLNEQVAPPPRGDSDMIAAMAAANPIMRQQVSAAGAGIQPAATGQMPPTVPFEQPTPMVNTGEESGA
jgi:hypothetical protein